MIQSAKPAAALRRFIRSYVHIEEGFDVRVLRPIPARTAAALEFTFGDPFDIHRYDRPEIEIAHPVAVIGAQTYRRVQLAMQGKVETFVIVFQPAGINRLFSLPEQELTDQHFEGRAVLGPTLYELARKLGDVHSFVERISLVNEYLATRMSGSGSCDGIAEAAHQVIESRGCVRISDLAQGTGLGLRHFERRFKQEVGMTPKLFARIARFEAAVESKTRSPDRRWTDIAYELGYYDQMHMVHDFQHLSGESPTCVASQLEKFVERPVPRASFALK